MNLSLEDIEAHILRALRQTTDAVVLSNLQAARIGLQAHMSTRLAGGRDYENSNRMLLAAITDLGLVAKALGLDPDDGGAEPILAAIEELKAQFEHVDLQNHLLRRSIQRIMARLTSLLDEDQFADVEDIAKQAGVEAPGTAVPIGWGPAARGK